ncbi:MAG: hypothetical protein EA378_06725 [Phycisphaerales bacterium]|nr:MAG: hypothetical protein EA378_06725 [Phycisphaerales bacterium]
MPTPRTSPKTARPPSGSRRATRAAGARAPSAMLVRTLAGLAMLGACLTPATAQERRAPALQPERVLIDRSLRERVVVLESIDDQRVRFTDRDGLTRSLPIDDVFALLTLRPAPLASESAPHAGAPSAALERAHAEGRVRLRTGESLPGALLGLDPADRAGAGEAPVRWLAPAVGEVRIAIDDIERLTLREGLHEDAETDPFADTVVLTNGDTLRGFIESLGDTVALDTDRGMIELEQASVAFVRFAEAPAPPRPRHMLALEGGVVLAARATRASEPGELRLALARGEVAGEPAEPSEGDSISEITVPFSAIEAVRFHARELVPLASLEPERVEPVGDRAHTDPPRPPLARPLGLDDLAFDGPLASTWIIPAGADAFATTALLPERWRVWGDCTLTVTITIPGEAPRELARVRLREREPEHRLRFDLPDPDVERRRLTLRLEPGPRGPIQNRVTLERPVFRLRAE